MNNLDFKIIFMGTPEFAVPALEKLIEQNYQISAVITAPDAPIGRKQTLTPSPIKTVALKNNISVLEPQKIKEPVWQEKIKELNPDLIIVCAYGQIMPKEMLDIPKFKSINIHPSLLPKYRGASPIQYAIMDGTEKTGVTIMLMDEQMDHGPILAQRELEFPISNFQFPKLKKELSELGAELLIETLPKWINREIKPQEQNHDEATFTKIIKKEDGEIKWEEPAQTIENKIRAFNPWPGIYTYFNKKLLKITEAEALKSDENLKSGQVFKIKNDIAVKCGSGAFKIKTLQIEGKKPTDIKSFINGYPEFLNTVLPN